MTGITETRRATETEEIKIEGREEEIEREGVIMMISDVEYVIDRDLMSLIGDDIEIDVRVKVRDEMIRVERRGDHEEGLLRVEGEGEEDHDRMNVEKRGI